MDGYVITRSGDDALEAFEFDSSIRFAAKLDTGEGLIATDEITPWLASLGRGFAPTGPSAFVWPWRAAPKRAIGTGTEAFALFYVAAQDAVVGGDAGVEVYELDGPAIAGATVLVEYGHHVTPASAAWSGRVVAFLDRRATDPRPVESVAGIV